MSKVLRRAAAVFGVVSLVFGTLVVVEATTAGAATQTIACTGSVGSTTALASAITTANSAADADIINITGGPCTFSFSTIGAPGAAGSGNDTALPFITNPLTINGNGSTLTRAAGAPNMRILTSTASTLTLNQLIVTGGNLVLGNGGAGIAVVNGALTLTSSVVSGNTVGGVTSAGKAANGGGIAMVSLAPSAPSILTMTGSQVNSNTANGSGGGIAIVGAGASSVTASGSLFQGNSATSSGGALSLSGAPLTLTDSQIQLNAAGSAGAIGIGQVAGQVSTIRRSAFVLNSGTSTIGGIWTLGGDTQLENDTFYANLGGNGYAGVVISPNGTIPGTATVASSTFVDDGPTTPSGNTAPGSSLATCVAACGGSGTGTANIHVRNSLIVDSDSTAAPTVSPCNVALGGTITNDGGNFEFPTNTCTGFSHVDPKLAPLVASNANTNGGVTSNFRLQSSSPAIDAAVGACPATDQRSALRPGGNSCDSGSYETQPPDTTVTGATSPTNHPSLTLSSNVAGATFQCNVDGGAFSACTSPYTPTLTDGAHTIAVKASANDATSTQQTTGNVYTDPSPASATFTVDTTAPTVDVASVPLPTNDNTPTLAFSTSGSPVTVTCKIDTGTAVACAAPSYTVPTALSDGPHTILVTATDAAGNVGSDSEGFTVDTVGPTVTINSGPTGSIINAQADFTFSGSDANDTYTCALDTGAATSCTSPASYSGFAPGPHTFTVSATDLAGNTGPAATRSFTYDPDVTAPVVTVDTAPPTNTNVHDATVTFHVSEPSTITCKVDALAPVSCTAPTFTASGLADGAHTIVIVATDPSHNVSSPATVTFTVDTVAPVVTITSAPAVPPAVNTDNTPSVAFTVDDSSAAVTCQVDNDEAVPCTSPFEPGVIFDGTHTIQVRAVDAAGNATTATTHFIVESTPPNTIIAPSGPTGTVNTTTATLTFSASEAGASFECRIDGGDFASCISPVTYTGLGQGFHLFRVRATDSAGNVDPTPAERSWTVDAVPPVVAVGTVPTPTKDNTVTVTFTVDDAAAAVTCKVDTGAAVPCASGFTTAALPDGPHSVTVTATDAAGNAGHATVLFVVDTSPPDTTITAGPTGTVYYPATEFTFTSELGTTFACSLDGAAYTACQSPLDFNVAPGTHTFAVRATDAAGNVDPSPAVRTWTYKSCTLLVDLGTLGVVCV